MANLCYSYDNWSNCGHLSNPDSSFYEGGKMVVEGASYNEFKWIYPNPHSSNYCDLYGKFSDNSFLP